jgi:hypothetical protein
VCERPRAEPGRRWCRECRQGYQIASRILLSFQGHLRPAAVAGVIEANIKRYRKRASRGLPLFEGP